MILHKLFITFNMSNQKSLLYQSFNVKSMQYFVWVNKFQGFPIKSLERPMWVLIRRPSCRNEKTIYSTVRGGADKTSEYSSKCEEALCTVEIHLFILCRLCFLCLSVFPSRHHHTPGRYIQSFFFFPYIYSMEAYTIFRFQGKAKCWNNVDWVSAFIFEYVDTCVCIFFYLKIWYVRSLSHSFCQFKYDILYFSKKKFLSDPFVCIRFLWMSFLIFIYWNLRSMWFDLKS